LPHGLPSARREDVVSECLPADGGHEMVDPTYRALTGMIGAPTRRPGSRPLPEQELLLRYSFCLPRSWYDENVKKL